jgi:hypothetical protein
LDDPSLAARFAGKAVFVGVTAETMVRDRLFTPYAYGRSTTGIEINASAFETIAQKLFITDVGEQWVLLFSLALVAAAGLSFRYLPGWWAYAGGAAVLLASIVTPYICFTHREGVFAGHASGGRDAGKSDRGHVLPPGGAARPGGWSNPRATGISRRCTS